MPGGILLQLFTISRELAVPLGGHRLLLGSVFRTIVALIMDER